MAEDIDSMTSEKAVFFAHEFEHNTFPAERV